MEDPKLSRHGECALMMVVEQVLQGYGSSRQKLCMLRESPVTGANVAKK
jgi:hypothetical protein